MTRIDRHSRQIAQTWALAGGVMLLAVVAVSTGNAALFGADKIARLGGSTVAGLPGYEEFVRLAVGVAVPMFLPWCQVRNGHVSVDIFTHALPASFERALDRLWGLLIAALAFFLAAQMWEGMVRTRSDGVISRVLEWPEWPFFLPGVVSLGLWGLVALLQAAGLIALESQSTVGQFVETAGE